MEHRKKFDTVALIGFAPVTRVLVPREKPDIEFWTLNEARMMVLPHIETLFQLHPRYMWDPNPRDSEYLTWMKAQDCPVYMWDREYDIPNSVKYPLDEVIAEFGSYLTSTFGYMLALAVHMRYKRIEIYGIDLVAEEEYRYQRAGTEYLIGFAKGLGIDVYIPKECPLLQAPLYGRYGPQEAQTLWTEEQIAARVTQLTVQKQKLMADLNAVDGALQENHNWRHMHMRDKHTNNGLEVQAAKFAGEVTTVANGQPVQSDGTNQGHTGMLEPVVV